ncbi:NAD-dependent epimerase/dehydratase family protein [Aureivirga marina]|uniref:NAD-dependent epimerase/dehydratase family protein n=1 Tax=Aureivirga marina TaxID=1182451 RepID=UPI0018C8D9AB|nr:NAD(P)-dependent oxidoreductase [Aureivirga marina]
MKTKKVIIVGATGFIGSHVVEQFFLADYKVKIVVRKESNYKRIEQFCDEILTTDFSNEKELENAFENQDLLVNCIASVKIGASLKELNKTSVDLIRKITKAAIKVGVKRFFLLSTVEVYGFIKHPIKKETLEYKPTYDFQRTHIEKEKIFKEICEKSTVDYIILQPASTIGKWETNTSFFKPMYEMHKKGFSLLINKGKAKVALVDTRDIGKAFVFFAEYSEIKNETFLLKGYTLTWLELKRELDKIRKKQAKEINMHRNFGLFLANFISLFNSEIFPPLAIDMMCFDMDVNDEKLRKIGFTPTISDVKDSMKEAIQYFRGE